MKSEKDSPELISSDVLAPEGELGVDRLVREIFLAFVKVHLLHHAAEAPIYGIDMIEELTRHGYKIGPGTIYPTLHALRAKGYLTEEKRVVNGKVRKYYHITPLGEAALAQLRPKVRELVGEVLDHPKH